MIRKQYHFRDSDQGLLAWNVQRLITLSTQLPTKTIALSDIQELDEAYWYDLGGAKPTCRNILTHTQLIQEASLDYPILLCSKGRVLDGMHRICKAVLAGHTSIKAKQFKQVIEPDFINVPPEKLPY